MVRTCVAVGAILGCRLILAQPAAPPRPQFDVASIKPNKSENSPPRIGPMRGGRFTMTNGPILAVLQTTYGLRDFQIIGAPGWLMSEHYDIEAEADGDPPFNTMKMMLQTLLEDRLQLKSHWETRQLPIYALVVAKPGKLQPAEAECKPATPPPPGSRSHAVPCGQIVFLNNSRTGLNNSMTGRSVTIAQMTTPLSALTRRMVIDKTGITGKYDINVQFSLERHPIIPPAGNSSPVPEADSDAPSLFTALEEQLGLRLQADKGPVDVLVIDHIERPTEN